ncbi:ATP-binding protein [Streptomyces sp. NPDC055952]|uniref:ATP-binding protein n=1 Tax=Streptomyces sp. NPDC055952 TaxID=3345663 RepID=UPI0035D9AAFB
MIPSAPLGTDAAAGLPGLGAGADPLGAAAPRRFRFELAAHPGSPAQARRLTRARLTGWSVCEDTCDSAALVVSELVTNAIVHTASTHIVCELHDGDDLVRIAVRDEGCAPGQPHAASRTRPEEEHGRGLLLVDALCHAWGAHEHGPGLLVWAELPRAADAGADPAGPWNDLDWAEPGQDGTAHLPGGHEPDGTAHLPGGDDRDHPRTTSPGSEPDRHPAAPLRHAPGHHHAAPLRDEPRNDLGWGARPKRGTSDGSEDGEDPAPEASRRAPGTPEVPAQHRRTERGPV